MDSLPTHFSLDQKMDTWYTLLLSYQSLGVVFGHLSIGPLYVFKIIDTEDKTSEETFYGLFSLIFWTMTLIPLLKYVFIVLRADDNGEGGTFALYSLICRHAKVGLLPNTREDDEDVLTCDSGNFSTKVESRAKMELKKNKISHYLMLLLALLGSCVVIGNGILVPTVSVSSASQNLGQSLELSFFKSQGYRETEFQKYFPVPTACTILIGLFVLQHFGTQKIGFLFAPIIILWLLFISGLGVYNVLCWNSHVIHALSPEYMYKFLRHMDIKSRKSLSAVLLSIAGSEAMFADLGHFSRKSIKIAFILVVYPSLILSYMGQTAYISKNWDTLRQHGVTDLGESIPTRGIRHLFTLLSLLASAVGSQATITATFSIINQCLALGCFPRVKVVHTSNKIHGQVYIPDINWILMLLCLALTIAFKDAVHIGNAIGLATITGLLITTCFMSLIIALYWKKVLVAACFLLLFGSIEAMYFISSLQNFQKGTWLLIFFVELFLIIMLLWHYGTRKKYEFDMDNKVSIEWLTSLGPSLGFSQVPGIGFVHADIMTGIPSFFSHFVTNIPAIHQVIIFVSFKAIPIPSVPQSMRYFVGRLGSKEHRAYRCIIRYGYRDNIGDINEFEDQIISSIGEFISLEDGNSEHISPQEKMIAIGSFMPQSGASITMAASNPGDDFTPSVDPFSPEIKVEKLESKRKKVRFVLPPQSPQLCSSAQAELQELVDARELGITYILGQSHYFASKGSSLLRRFMINLYIFLVNNCRETSVVLNIPQTTVVQVGMAYSI